jgi:acyl-CoA synthetase (AMP-forming)/AMP-acid ligase II
MNIGGLLTNSARVFPKRLAVVYGSRRLTYRQFNSRANRLANAFRRLGIKTGESVAILQYNYPEMLESMFACFKSGIGAVPINFRLHPKEYAYIIHHSQARAVVLSREFNQDILAVRQEIPRARHLITLSDSHGELLDYETIISAETGEWSDADIQPDDVAWLFYTSGTTGQPKGAMLTHRNLLAMTLAYYADYGHLEPDDAVLHAAPLSHGSGLYALPNIAKAATNIILESKTFQPELVFKTIEKYRVTNMFAAPTMIKLMVEDPEVRRYALSSLRSLIYGGGPMHMEDLKEAIQTMGFCLTQLYGMGETPMTITYLPQKDHILEGPVSRLKRLSAAGIPRTGVEVKVFDIYDQEVPEGEIGQVVTRSDVVMKGYWRNPEATAEALKGGWLHTGDVGYMDSEGYLFLMDRFKDMIISGGENIYPREIEEVIIRHPAVREVAVIGVPDSKWGESIKAVVSLIPGESVTKQELVDLCETNLASYKKPKSIDFIDELPKNNYGKIMKRNLRDRYWKGQKRLI